VREEVAHGDGALVRARELVQIGRGGRVERKRASTSCKTAVVVATTFVSEARSKIVSAVVAMGAGQRRPERS